jgi:hypothetical protein
MSDPAVVGAVITGAVAFMAILGTMVTTGRTLRHQREAEDQRRRHERYMRLLESGLKAAVDFLAAADRTSRARQAVGTATISFDGARSSGNEQTYQRFLAKLEGAREDAYAATADAENAYTAIRLLIPSVASQARRYLDLCGKADAHPDETKVDRERARQAVEETIQRALGGDLPVNWMFAEPKGLTGAQ